MKIPDFLKRHAPALSDFQSLVSEKPTAGLATLFQISNNLLKEYDFLDSQPAHKTSQKPAAQNAETPPKPNALQVSQSSSEPENSQSTAQAHAKNKATEPVENHEDSAIQQRIFYFHVMSKCHVDAFILERPEAKEIFEGECLHYGRVCEIAITNYCIMDNHFHLNVGVRACSLEKAHEQLAQMMGSIKQQFTRRFKIWYNITFRREIRHRKPKLGTGTLWAGPFRAEFIKDEAQLAASTLYTEANRIKVSCAEQITQLNEPPQVTHSSDDNNQVDAQSEYRPLLQALYNNPSQSARFYLADAAAIPANTALTDGFDGNWASDEEVQKYWHLPAYSLPADWRKVHYGNERRILKPTPAHQRTYHTTSFIERLGRTPSARRQNFAQLVLGICWKGRARITKPSDEDTDDQQVQGPGISC